MYHSFLAFICNKYDHDILLISPISREIENKILLFHFLPFSPNEYILKNLKVNSGYDLNIAIAKPTLMMLHKMINVFCCFILISFKDGNVVSKNHMYAVIHYITMEILSGFDESSKFNEAISKYHRFRRFRLLGQCTAKSDQAAFKKG